MVHSHLASPTVFRYKWAVTEHFCRLLGQVPVATANLNTCKAELTSYSLWQ